MRLRLNSLSPKVFAWLKMPQNLGLVGIFLIAAVLRLATIQELHWISFLDGGRDVLVAKWLAEGKVDWIIAPKSGLDALPNSPVYYLILAMAYTVAGLNGVVGLQFLLGLGVVWLTYLIARLFTSRIISILITFQAAISFTLIDVSQAVWQPNWEYFFGALSLFLSFKALILGKSANWYWLSLISIWLMLMTHHSGLPIAIIMTICLSLSWWRNFISKDLKAAAWFYYIGIIALWLSWWQLTFGLVENSGSLFANSKLDFSQGFVKIIFERITGLFKNLLWVISSQSLKFVWLNLSLFFGVLYSLVKAKKDFFKPYQLLYWQTMFILLSLVLAMFSPGEQFRPWYFFIQFYLFFVVLNVTPSLRHFKLRHQIYFQIGLLILSLIINFNQIKFSITPRMQESFRLSQEAAKIIDADVRHEWVKPNNFSIIVNRKFDERFRDLEFYWTDYKSSSVQLALEYLNPIYQTRIKISPLVDTWTNYLQPHAKVTYVICQDYVESNKLECVTDIQIGENNSAKRRITYLDKIILRELEYVFLYRLETD